MPNWVAAFEEHSKCYCCYLTSVAAPLSVSSVFFLPLAMFSFSHSKNLITFKGFLFLLFAHCLDCFLDWLWWKWPFKLLFSSTQSDARLLKRRALQFTWSSCFFINMPTKACEIIFFIYYSPSSNQELPSVFQIPRNLKGDQDSTTQNN